MSYESWGRFPHAEPKCTIVLDQASLANVDAPTPRLAYGRGRSYGDVCLNDQGTILDTQRHNHFISFDRATGIVRAESGVTLKQILDLAIPRGWFLPVSPGTKHVTIGGAVANDIHGKNHHRAGTFGCHVRQFELVRSNGDRIICSPSEHADLFAATIGGLGLTGLMSWVELQLKPIASPLIENETIKMKSLDDFFTLSEESDKTHEYTVAWLDSTAPKASIGRGLFMRGNHAKEGDLNSYKPAHALLSIPFEAPSRLLNHWSIKAFNAAYYHKQLSDRSTQNIPFEPFFYPLDILDRWNLLYGKTGFVQYQCVIPMNKAKQGIRELLEIVHETKLASFLSVLKIFGEMKSPGLLSFPQAGATLALDVRFEGEKTRSAFRKMDEIVRSNGGRLYPAKDALMTGEMFVQSYTRLNEFIPHIDPAFESNFWRRMKPAL